MIQAFNKIINRLGEIMDRLCYSKGERAAKTALELRINNHLPRINNYLLRIGDNDQRIAQIEDEHRA